MQRVVGIGGVFFKAENPEKLKEWYGRHLGLKVDSHGAFFKFPDVHCEQGLAGAQWSPFEKETEYFAPSKKEFMINFRVEDLSWLHKELEKEGVEIVGDMQEYSYGKFLHIMDLEGNKIELWQPLESF